MHGFRPGGWLLAAALLGTPALAADMTRAQALAAVEQADAALRLSGVERLAEVGSMADAEQLLRRLGDASPRVRDAAESARCSHP